MQRAVLHLAANAHRANMQVYPLRRLMRIIGFTPLEHPHDRHPEPTYCEATLYTRAL